LVKKGLKEVVVDAVDEEDVDVHVIERLGDLEPAESASHDDDA
jgi:hypothetical protein